PRQLSAHSKLAMLVTIIVLSIGTAVIFVSEEWPPSVILGDRLLLSSFQTISASTTDGFNTIDIAKMSHTSLFTLVVLMFIGASPGGTAGGIKTTTLGIMFVSLVSLFRGKSYVHIFKRAIPDETVHRSFVIFLSFVLVLIIDVAVLAAIENASFLEILFESTSALSNTGLSMGITPNLSIVGKIFLTIAMFIGRIGPLAIGFSLFGRPKPELLRYPEGEILVG
ncbi:MAG TPA: potassium transporter TrkG, partial [Candidatus Tripitaka californicus]